MRRILIIAFSAAFALYVVPGIVAGAIVPNEILAHRGSDVETLQSAKLKTIKNRDDYPLLSARTEHHFVSDGNTLTGYHYLVENAVGLVILVHGMNGLSDGPESALANFYMEQGYSVFAFDLTACGRSEGRQMGTLYQSSHDTLSAYDYAKNAGFLEGKLVFSGYSWGAYGASDAFSKVPEADALIAFSGYDCPVEEYVSMANTKTNGFANLMVPPFVPGVWMRQGQEAFARISSQIGNRADRCFFVQGMKDDVVTYEASIARHMAETKAEIVLLQEGTHRYPWFSANANAYFLDEVKPRLSSDNPEDIAFIAGVSKDKTSEFDPVLATSIADFLQNKEDLR